MSEEAGEQAESGQLGQRTGILLPHNRECARSARRMVVAPSLRVGSFAAVISEDPSIAIEFLRLANGITIGGDKQAITTLSAAVVRLGSQFIVELLDGMQNREAQPLGEATSFYDDIRKRALCTGHMCRILANVVAPSFTEECMLSGIFSGVGELLCILKLKQHYVELARSQSRAGLLYRISTDHKFNVEQSGLSYLARSGIPQVMLNTLDRTAEVKSEARKLLRPILQASTEFVDSFEEGRWEKIAPGKQLPPKSAIRFLQLAPNIYERIYSEAAEVFQKVKEGKSTADSIILPSEGADNPEIPGTGVGTAPSPGPGLVATVDVVQKIETVTAAPPLAPLPPVQVAGIVVPGLAVNSAPLATASIRVANAQAMQPPTCNNESTMSTADRAKATRSWRQLMELSFVTITGPGLFSRAVFFRVDRAELSFRVEASPGSNLAIGSKLPLGTAMSQFFAPGLRLQALIAEGTPESPFGTKVYAVSNMFNSPYTNIFLYADCGEAKFLSLDARRSFKAMVDILNVRLSAGKSPDGVDG